MELIHELAKSKTVILISHRLANVAPADTIYVMREGRVEERGTPQSCWPGAACTRPLWKPAGAGGTMRRKEERRYENTGICCDGPPCEHGAALLLPVMVRGGHGRGRLLCAIFIPVLGGYALLDVLRLGAPLGLRAIFGCVLAFALARACCTTPSRPATT